MRWRSLLTRDDQALFGDNHPAAVLLADGIDAAEAGNVVAGIDFPGSAAIADQRAAIADIGEGPAFDGRQAGDLRVGDQLDGSTITKWELVPYAGGRTYDLLPAGATGFYWANGIVLSSTLHT